MVANSDHYQKHIFGLFYVAWNTLWKCFLFSFLYYHRSSVQLWFSPLMAQGIPASESNTCLHFCLCRMSIISSMIIFSGTEISLLWFHTRFSCKNLCWSPASHLPEFWEILFFPATDLMPLVLLCAAVSIKEPAVSAHCWCASALILQTVSDLSALVSNLYLLGSPRNQQATRHQHLQVSWTKRYIKNSRAMISTRGPWLYGFDSC